MVAARRISPGAWNSTITAGGSGEPLVLIHGIGHTWRGWKPMLPLLEPRFDVLAVDLPGFGHSPPLPPGTEATPESLADAVEQAMDEAGFDRAARGRQLPRRLDRARARSPRPRAAPWSPSPPPGSSTCARGAGEGTSCSGCARAPATCLRPMRLLRTRLGCILFAGPAIAPARGASTPTTSPRFSACSRTPGFLATLPHTFERAAEGPERDRRAGADPVGHARPAPAAPAGQALRAADPGQPSCAI